MYIVKSNIMRKLEKELSYFVSKQPELIKKYNGKFVAIKNAKVIGVFDYEFEAYSKVQRENRPGTFLVKQCLPPLLMSA